MEFSQALKIIGEMLGKGEAFISLSPPVAITIEIDRAVVRTYFRESQGSDSVAKFREQASEIGQLLLPILEGTTEQFVNARVKQRSEDKTETRSNDDYRKELTSKIEDVRKHLYDERLQKRYNLKKSSKAPSFSDIDWDIKTKHVDAKIESLTPFPYATCKITFQKEFEMSFPSILNAFGSIQINFSVDEIHYLQRVLSTIEERLRSLEKELSKHD